MESIEIPKCMRYICCIVKINVILNVRAYVASVKQKKIPQKYKCCQ